MPEIHTTPPLSISTIAEGPAFAETLLMARIKEKDLHPKDRCLECIEMLKKGTVIEGRQRAAVQNFYLGHFYEQVAARTDDPQASKFFAEAALAHYNSLIRAGGLQGEPFFYAHLRTGQLMNFLGSTWPPCEKILLQAYALAPGRGEPMEAIIRYYLSAQQWAIAYIFSSFSKENFFNKLPVKNIAWGLHDSFYHWKVLDLHTAVCFNAGAMEEAWDTYSTLLQTTTTAPQHFTTEDLKKILDKGSLFQQNTAEACPN